MSFNTGTYGNVPDTPSPRSNADLELLYRPMGSPVRSADLFSKEHRNSVVKEDETINQRGKRKPNPLAFLYFSLSRMFGFREKFSLGLMSVFGGALLAFCLAKSMMLDEKKRSELTSAGDMFWFRSKPYKASYAIHIILSTLGGICVGLQFLPTIRRNRMWLHRLNGTFCLVTVIISNVGGCIVARRSFGGELNVQSAYYTIGIISTVAMCAGFWYARKDTRKHRRWMMRGVVYFSIVVTTLLIKLAANAIIPRIGSYYSVWRCDEILFVLRDIASVSKLFPRCPVSTSDTGVLNLTSPATSVSVRCTMYDEFGKALGKSACGRATQGMALWIGTLLHVIGVEIYLQSTERANVEKVDYTLQPKQSNHLAMSGFL
ncbi:hypothetical protein AAF712_014806 [Marasmius tenuissimus]|uniref:Uncharacterized protein n=1 Tax=Marasmius tenuissimus TaxID=585030 RepID=A0ABR2ZDH4_9AGAR